MEYLDEEIYPVKRPAFLTVLCILTFIGSGWAILGAFTTYKTAGNTVARYTDSLVIKRAFPGTETDSFKIEKDSLSADISTLEPDSLQKNSDSSRQDSLSVNINDKKEGKSDTVSAEFNMGRIFGQKMKKNRGS